MRRMVVLVLAGVLVAGCSARDESAEEPAPSPTTPAASSTPTTPSPTPTKATNSGRPVVGNAPPSWLGKRVLPLRPDGYGEMRPTPPQLQRRAFTLPDTSPELAGRGFQAEIHTPAPASVIRRSTWAPGCPVGRRELSWIRLSFWGFDDQRHTGELLVNVEAVDDLVTVFHRLYADHFPIEEMRITTKPEQTAPPTGDGNDTGAFNCRATRGATSYSQHAYGLAVDVNPFQNPYTKGDPPNRIVLPELASSYLDRDWHRPGMIEPDGPVVAAFAAVGWTWGGTWRSLRDLQHFSRNGQ